MKIYLILTIFFIFIIMFLSGCTSGPGEYDAFANCLTEEGVVMYGTEWCSHCQNQKKMFGSSFEYINFVDCDKNKNECLDKDIQGYPTWRIDGKNYPGEQSINDLKTSTGCEL